MKRRKNYWFAMPLAIIFASGCVSVRSADPIEATVVDSQTGEPIAGVVVVAHWQLRTGGFPETQEGGQLEVQESVSDPDGKIRFPGFSSRVVAEQLDRDADPELILFKPGYLPDMVGTGPYETPRRKNFKGAQLTLTKIDSNEPRFKDAFSATRMRVRYMSTHPSTPCEWKRIPRMIATLRQQQKLERQQGIVSSGLYDELIANEEGQHEFGCGSVKEFFSKEHIE